MALRHHTSMTHWPHRFTLMLAASLLGCDRAPQTYSAGCATPLPNWKAEKDGIGHLVPIMSVFLTTDGSVLWNRVAVSNDKLRFNMSKASTLNPLPQIVLQVSPSASCSRVDEVRSIMSIAPICKGPYSRCSEGWKPEEWPMFGGPCAFATKAFSARPLSGQAPRITVSR